MATPDQYRSQAQGRVSSAAGDAVVDNGTGRVVLISPNLQASPESDEAEVPGGLVSRSDGWFPAFWLDAVQANDDPMLARDGSDLRLYDALLSDDTAMSTLQQRRLAITSRDWEVAPGNPDDPRSVTAADEFREMLKAVGFDRVTGGLHYGVWFGYAVAEAVYTTKTHDGRLIIWLDDIVIPDRRWFGFTGEGQLRFIGDLSASIGGEVVPDNKFITVRTGGTHDFAFYGLGLAHWCYWPIFFKRAALKFWALYLEKMGRPTVGIAFSEADKNDQKKKANLLQAAMAIGQDSAVLLPEGYLDDAMIKIFESGRTLSSSSDYKDFVTEQNEAIMRVVLGQPGTSKATKGGLGGDGQARKDEGVKREIVKADSDLISEGMSKLGRWLTTWNHGADVAPPTVYRVLDDEEDLNTVATRDVQLNGIGIKRTEESVREVYGDGYEVDRLSTEEQAARDQALAAAKTGAAVAAGGNVVDMAAERRKRVAEFAAQGGETAFSPLYVHRKLINADEVIAWARKQGFTGIEKASDLHVTVLYSKQAVDWFKMAGEGWDWGEVTVEKGGPRFVERFGDALVLRFASPALTYRHESMIERGASTDFPDYNPHVTITYEGGDVNLSEVEPFAGELRFGPELFEPIKADPTSSSDFLAFSASQEDAIDRLAAAMVEESHPVFAAMAEHLRGALEGVKTPEAARVAILKAAEDLPLDRLAKLTALPMLAERAGALAGADDAVVG